MKDQHVVYKTEGVCASEISFDIVDGAVFNIKFEGGCRGNTQGVAALAEGLPAEDVIRRCKGIDCHGGQSCPNELVKAIEQAMNE
ncbi:MAG: TIGR03905 family TSCPD domain-containing protein [Oscillospiraceae bacterium]|nr:TIGR03905 family TSCPD domain-containing protein [Oscillospiraceae bacterium]